MNQYYKLFSLLSIFFALTLLPKFSNADLLQKNNVIWNTPSKDHNGSMPIGNGDLALNVWVEQDGDLFLLLSKTDSWSGNARLLKLGRVRISISPNPFHDPGIFKQSLLLQNGEIQIGAGNKDSPVTIRIWADANRPVIHIETEGKENHEINTTLEIWRKTKRELTGEELVSAYGLHDAPFPVYVYPDQIIGNAEKQIIWYHRNEQSIWENNLTHQGLTGLLDTLEDPLLNRTFGGCIQGEGLINESPTILTSVKPQKRFHLSIYPLTSITESVEEWLQELNTTVDTIQQVEISTARSQHYAWWKEFWNRSWIYASGTSDAETVTRGYVLQRWINACACRGAFPIKFNGSLFTVNGLGFDPDFRRWGGPYWWQNTRLPYWPMLTSGDFDLMLPLFRMYQEMTDLQEYRTQEWYGHSGSFTGETVYFWGMYTNANYGWQRDTTLPVGELVNPYIRREYTASLELLSMMLDYYDYTKDEAFAHETLLPMSDSLLRFWDQHYKVDQHGKLFIYPAQALETLQDAFNPTPDTAGLRWVLEKLLDLETELTGSNRNVFWEELLSKVPDLPLEKDGNATYLIGAEKYFGGRGNSENPELYAVFPFRIFGLHKPNLRIGLETFQRRAVKGNHGWRQDDTQAAFLGLTETATQYLIERAKTKHDQSRFPAFWGPNFDWIPDQDHGGNLMKTLQTMLLQADNDKIYLMPAWPKEWNVSFKLHAPAQTVLEGVIEQGKLIHFTVTPSHRKDDITIVGQ